jgi:hypothetical protein
MTCLRSRRSRTPVLERLEDRTLLNIAWSGFARDPQHDGYSTIPSQSLDSIHWHTPVDLAPQYSGNDLLIHYGTPLVTGANTVIVPVKTGASGGFRIEAHSGASGALAWSSPTDYVLPPGGGWTPSYSPALTPTGRVYFPGAGGTVYYIDNPDAPGPKTRGHLAFYGIGNYTHAGFDGTVYINTPITADANGTIYFGFQVTGSNPLGLVGGIARIDATGAGSWVAASVLANDSGITKIVTNSAPALSNDGSVLYAAVDSGDFTSGYVVALNSTTLAPLARVALIDPTSGWPAYLSDSGTASPSIGPDGDVYMGVLEHPFNSSRGWLLHFTGDLSQQKITGAFGWDDTASMVPSWMVPSYHGTSSYLVFSKYNNYAGLGGDGINKIAILDPNDTEVDPRTGATVMKEVLTIAGPTPDPDHPGGVREWCINSAAVDPATDSVLANSEDGKLYRWNLSTNSLVQVVTLTAGIGEAYTPTAIGADGTVYAINNATLFAVGKNSWDTFGHDAQHSGISAVGGQALDAIHWQTSVDLAYSGGAIHYGSPIITPANTVLVPVKSDSTGHFEVSAFKGSNGTPEWTVTSDYSLPPTYDWVPSYNPTYTSTGRLYFPGAGGTLLYTDNADSTSTPTTGRLAFFGIANYNANPGAYNSTVFIDTPITSDNAGDVYFGFRVTGSNPSGLVSGIARIDEFGNGTWIAAATATGDVSADQMPHNSAPALSNDGRTLYVAVRNDSTTYYAYLVALDSTTLTPLARVFLYDPNGNPGRVSDDSTSSPTIGPDGDVYFGILENPYAYNHDRGWLLHFSPDLQTEYTPGDFGWDDTPAIVPATMVPSYHGTSSYLLFSKYNNYNDGLGGDGINKIAILDPHAIQVDPQTGATVMKEVLTIAGPTPDPANPGGVKEWCINAAAVDPFHKAVYANSEDGKLYRWNLVTDTLDQSITLTGGVGEAYTPTAIGPDGTVYAINEGVLFAVGSATLTPVPRTITPKEGIGFSGVVGNFRSANPSAKASDFTATIDWGDGTTSTGTVASNGYGGFQVAGSRTYAEEGSFAVNISVHDASTQATVIHSTATVADAPLSAKPLTFATKEGLHFNGVVGNFRDGNTHADLADFSATIDWGDGTSTTGTVASNGFGGFQVTGSHSYAEEGSYPVNITVHDAGGSSIVVQSTASVADAPLTPKPLTFKPKQGTSFTGIVGNFRDGNPSPDVNDFTASIKWGDGTTTTGTVAANGFGGFKVTGTHTYTASGNFGVQITIIDQGGSTTIIQSTATVAPGGAPAMPARPNGTGSGPAILLNQEDVPSAQESHSFGDLLQRNHPDEVGASSAQRHDLAFVTASETMRPDQPVASSTTHANKGAILDQYWAQLAEDPVNGFVLGR